MQQIPIEMKPGPEHPQEPPRDSTIALPATPAPGRFAISKEGFLFCLLLSVAFVVLYHDVIAHISSKWGTLDGSHGPLILAASLYLVWTRRGEIRALRAKPALLPGGLLLAAGCFTLFAGKLASTILIQQISMIPVLLGAILLYGGASLFKVFFLPVAYLLFLTGFLEQLLGSVAIHLQRLTAWLAVLFLKLIGFPVYHEGTLITLPNITLEVVRACSGINHIVALLALAVPLAHMTQRSAARKAIIVLSSVFIGIFANGMRVFLIGLYARYNPGADVHGPSETLVVSSVFFVGLIVLLLFSQVLSRKDTRNEARAQTSPAPPPSPTSLPGNENSSHRTRLAAICATGIILAFTFGLVHLYTPKPVDLQMPLELLPNEMAGFSGKDLEQLPARLRPFAADIELMRVYEDDRGHSINLYIGYFKIQDRSSKLIDYRRTWMHEDVAGLTVPGADAAFEINKTQLRQKSTNSDVYFWYQMGKRIIRNEYAGKFWTFVNTLVSRKSNGAVIVIQTRDGDEQIMPFLEDAIPRIHALLSAAP